MCVIPMVCDLAPWPLRRHQAHGHQGREGQVPCAGPGQRRGPDALSPGRCCAQQLKGDTAPPSTAAIWVTRFPCPMGYQTTCTSYPAISFCAGGTNANSPAPPTLCMDTCAHVTTRPVAAGQQGHPRGTVAVRPSGAAGYGRDVRGRDAGGRAGGRAGATCAWARASAWGAEASFHPASGAGWSGYQHARR